MSFVIALDGSDGALVVQSSAVNNGEPAFVGPQGSESLALATRLFNAA